MINQLPNLSIFKFGKRCALRTNILHWLSLIKHFVKSIFYTYIQLYFRKLSIVTGIFLWSLLIKIYSETFPLLRYRFFFGCFNFGFRTGWNFYKFPFEGFISISVIQNKPLLVKATISLNLFALALIDGLYFPKRLYSV